MTQANIDWANKRISELTLSIGDKEASIENARSAIASALRDIAEGERRDLVSILVTSKAFSEAWHSADVSLEFTSELKKNIEGLREARVVLSTNRDAVNKEKQTLLDLQTELQLQKRSVDATKATQQQLLVATKNQESSYQSLIAQKKAAEKSFEDQLVALQSQLNLIVNPGSLPKVGSGILAWPYSRAFMSSCASRKAYFGNAFCITQFFGNTPFSTANPQVYNGHGHNAIDIASPIGTPIQASLGGTVLDTGNTDLARGCYSFGKWVMIKHTNGINTLYSHLSTIDVSAGQSVSVGQVIGLSGMTGYATGPHLHFGVYASEGTKIQTLGAFRNAKGGCASVKMPVATLTAYLNPLSYL